MTRSVRSRYELLLLMRVRHVIKMVFLFACITMSNFFIITRFAYFLEEKAMTGNYLTDGFNLTLLFDGERRWKQNQLFKNRHDVEVEIPAKAQMTPNCSTQPVLNSKHSFLGNGIYEFFPHLASTKFSDLEPIMLTPTVLIRKKLVVCIPVVLRKVSYIEQTLKSLFNNLSDSVRDEVLFVVMFAFPNITTYSFKKLSSSVIHAFLPQINGNLLEVSAISPIWYEEDMESIIPSFNDSKERMYWRTKQNLDYFYLMSYGRQKADYYLHLEDDIIATPKYMRTILNYIKLKEGRPWFSMHFSTLGFIGKLFRSDDIKYITHAVASYYKHKPIDWIFLDVEYNIACSPEYKKDQCTKAIQQSRIMVFPSQFQHIGKISSLHGKEQKLKEKFFEKAALKIKRSNPAARIATSMPTYTRYTAQSGYERFSFMWFTKVLQGSNIVIEFEKPTRVTGIQMISGISPASSDTFAPDTRMYARDLHDNEVLLGNFSSYGDLVIRVNDMTLSALILKVHSNHLRWVIVGHVEIDVEKS
ncbi:hypothetical protein RB195_014691 [Necator americanus]|uniref:MGAT4 conserved region domain-containing protein n=1 Tax=Necator americanus TaxID=51031 RepID=A0ABR1E157_NECAM